MTSTEHKDSRTPRESPPKAIRGVLFLRERRWRAIAAASGIVFAAIAVGSGVWWAATGKLPPVFDRAKKPVAPAAPAPVAPAAPTARRAIDGAPAAMGAPTEYFAVMIDNLPAALPQAGIAKAPLVVEAPVEGGITRLMAVFPADAEVKKIGPVRSARPYYLDWAGEFDALYAHVGGSPEALNRLKTSDLRDLDEMRASAFFWRVASRKAPHSTYISTGLLAEALTARKRSGDPHPLPAWKFKDDAPPADRPDGDVTLTLGETGKWLVSWRYDKERNLWSRVFGGAAQADDDGSPVLAKNVVVQFTEVETIDEIGRRRIDTTSGGDALFAADGRIIGASWKKGAKDRRSAGDPAKGDGRTRFYDAAGNEIVFDAGTTWIEVVATGMPVTY